VAHSSGEGARSASADDSVSAGATGRDFVDAMPIRRRREPSAIFRERAFATSRRLRWRAITDVVTAGGFSCQRRGFSPLRHPSFRPDDIIFAARLNARSAAIATATRRAQQTPGDIARYDEQ
jgi:hypothetical protein